MKQGTWCKSIMCRAWLAAEVDFCPKCGRPRKVSGAKVAWQILTVLFSLFALWVYFHFKP